MLQNDQPTTGAAGAWVRRLRTTLTNVIGEANYDIGHLFRGYRWRWKCWCIGCVCFTLLLIFRWVKEVLTPLQMGFHKAITFDIDFVVAWNRSQLVANIFGAGRNSCKCGRTRSGSTIMGMLVLQLIMTFRLFLMIILLCWVFCKFKLILPSLS
jgi:hypothetical protein